MSEPVCPDKGNAIISERIAAFNESGFARLLGMKILQASDGFARVVMDSGPMTNPHGVVHGGAIFSLADQAFGIAANCAGIDRVAVSVHIQYIAPATGRLEATAERVADNGHYSQFRVMVFENNRIIAAFDGIALQVNPPPE